MGQKTVDLTTIIPVAKETSLNAFSSAGLGFGKSFSAQWFGPVAGWGQQIGEAGLAQDLTLA